MCHLLWVLNTFVFKTQERPKDTGPGFWKQWSGTHMQHGIIGSDHSWKPSNTRINEIFHQIQILTSSVTHTIIRSTTSSEMLFMTVCIIKNRVKIKIQLKIEFRSKIRSSQINIAEQNRGKINRGKKMKIEEIKDWQIHHMDTIQWLMIWIQWLIRI